MASFIPSLPGLSFPTFPDIPQLPGVPPLPRLPSILSLPQFSGIGGLPAVLGIIISAQNTRNGVIQYDDPDLPDPIPAAIWGLFNEEGEHIADVDSVLSVEMRDDSRISNYPLEQGSFAAYNKVAQPFAARVRLAKGGSVDDRSEFITRLHDAKEGLDLYVLSTPERAYLSCNVTHVGYPREPKNGANILLVEVWVEEVRQKGTATFTQTKEPSGAETEKAGYVQPRPAPSNAPTVGSIR